MQDSLKYICAQFGYDWTKNKEMVKEGVGVGGYNGPSPTYLTSKKLNPCRVKMKKSKKICFQMLRQKPTQILL